MALNPAKYSARRLTAFASLFIVMATASPVSAQVNGTCPNPVEEDVFGDAYDTGSAPGGGPALSGSSTNFVDVNGVTMMREPPLLAYASSPGTQDGEFTWTQVRGSSDSGANSIGRANFWRNDRRDNIGLANNGNITAFTDKEEETTLTRSVVSRSYFHIRDIDGDSTIFQIRVNTNGGASVTNINDLNVFIFAAEPGSTTTVTPSDLGGGLFQYALTSDSAGQANIRMTVESTTNQLLEFLDFTVTNNPDFGSDNIRFVARREICLPDFGDAPDTFRTLSSSNGPSHTVIDELRIGATTDEETEGQPSATAADDGADEDGVNSGSLVIVKEYGDTFAASLVLNNVTNNLTTDAQLACWVNFDGNTEFDQTAELSEPDFATHSLTGAPSCDPSTSDTWTSGNVPAGCSGSVTVLWTGLTTVPTSGTVMSRCRLTTEDGSTPGSVDWFANSAPSPVGPARDGEVEDTVLNVPPTAATIGNVELKTESIEELLSELGITDLETEPLLALLEDWSEETALSLADSDRAAILAALNFYLDPDGDGRVPILRWDTLEERGTIGFYVERQERTGGWTRLNSGQMLPGLIDAPLGGDYVMVIPDAVSGSDHLYRLVEQEAWGTSKTYGPYSLMP